MTTAETEYKLQKIEGGVATVAGTTKLTPHPLSRGEAETKPRMEITSQSIRVEATWDTREGHLIRRSTDGSVSFKAVLDVKRPIEASSTSTSHVAFTWVEGSPLPLPAPEK
jgi:hypothetical protein